MNVNDNSCSITAIRSDYWEIPQPYQELAVSFTPESNYDLAEIDVAIQTSNGTNSIRLSLEDDIGGFPNGDPIESWTQTSLPAFGTTSSVVQALLPVGAVPLSAGRTYWIVASANASDTVDVWNDNSLSSRPGPDAINGGTGWVSPRAILPIRPPVVAFTIVEMRRIGGR